jgi:membrane protein
VQGKIYYQLEEFLGKDTSLQLQALIKSSAISGNNSIAITLGAVALFIGATSIFTEIQDSINDIWGLKPKPGKNCVRMIQNRFFSFSIIVSLGFLLLVSLTITTLIEWLNTRLKAHFPDVAIGIFYVFNQLVTLIISTMIFAVIFKVLPDGKIKRRDIITGSVVTAVLFMFGKFAISFYISKSYVGTALGAAGSILVLLIWIYYSSMILYLGAEFTKAYVVKYGSEILPDKYAVTTKDVEIETGKASVQQNEKMNPVVVQKK